MVMLPKELLTISKINYEIFIDFIHLKPICYHETFIC